MCFYSKTLPCLGRSYPLIRATLFKDKCDDCASTELGIPVLIKKKMLKVKGFVVFTVCCFKEIRFALTPRF